jgi:hypothetical protein
MGSGNLSSIQLGGLQMSLVNTRLQKALVFAVGTFCFVFAVSARAQVQTTTTTTKGHATKQVTVEHAEVLLVEGNDLLLKMEDGSIRHIPNIPESDKIDVDGRQLGIHDLKPGMKLQHTITVTTTPQTVTTVQSVTGKVFHVSPPNSVILTLEDGTNQSFKIPKDQKFNIQGTMTDAWGLRKGMIVTATKVVEAPETVVSHERKVTGTMPAPPPAPPADVPILVAMAEPTAAPTASAETSAPAKLPKTASELPLVGLLGLLCIFASLGVRFLRANLGL